MKALCTGGAGFIGSHMVDWLLAHDYEVVVLDNFSTGRIDFLPTEHKGLTIIRGDCLNLAVVLRAISGCQIVFHFQANADVRRGKENTSRDLDQNVQTTWNVLEAMRISGIGVEHIVFASSAVVYGEPDVFPTPETYFGRQTSLYGATKLSAEGLIQSYANYFGFVHTILRFVSWIGERYTHGVIFDFVKQLMRSPNYLEVLGDGSQEKSYLHVEDGVEGIWKAMRSDNHDVFNLGHHETCTVRELATIVADEIGNGEVFISYGQGKRGWVGDSPLVQLDTKRLRETGWRPTVSIKDGIRRTVRYLKANPKLLERK